MTMEKEFEYDSYTCPSFSCYSSNRLADIAIRVAAEDNYNNNEDQDFEFALVHDEKLILSDEFSQNGPIFPVFNRNHTLNGYEKERSESCMAVPLGKLLMEEREEHGRSYAPSCSSSDDDDEPENDPEGKHCIWRPKPAKTTQSPSMCKKSKSTGSASKRWKFPDFMKRSNSEGKDRIAFLRMKNKDNRVPEKKKSDSSRKVTNGKVPIGIEKRFPSAHEAMYVRNRAVMEGNKKKSFLPYRQGLVGFSGIYERLW